MQSGLQLVRSLRFYALSSKYWSILSKNLRESPTLVTFRSKIGKLNFSYYVFLAVTVANFVVLVT